MARKPLEYSKVVILIKFRVTITELTIFLIWGNPVTSVLTMGTLVTILQKGNRTTAFIYIFCLLKGQLVVRIHGRNECLDLHCQLHSKPPCGSLDKNGLHRPLMGSLVGVGAALLEGVYHWKQIGFEVSGTQARPSGSPTLPAACESTCRTLSSFSSPTSACMPPCSLP